MIKASDSFYKMGTAHVTCDDFAVIGSWNEGQTHLAMVFDGCSGSPNSSVGARLLASELMFKFRIFSMTAQEIKTAFMRVLKNTLNDLWWKHKDVYGQKFLDCTILCAISGPEETDVVVIGDGSFTQMDKNKSLSMHLFSFGSEAPGYASYLLDENREDAFTYLAKTAHDEWAYSMLETPDTILKASITSFNLTEVPIRWYSLKHSDVARLVLTTDGIAQLVDEKQDKVPWQEACKALITFKNDKGQFLARKSDRILDRKSVV